MTCKETYENKLFHVHFQSVKDHSGNEVPNYLIVEPKQITENQVTGVAVLPVVDDCIALLRVYRPALQESVWEVPRGFVEIGEKHAESVTRELEEETGLFCSPKNLHSLGYMVPEAGILKARIHLFFAHNCQVRRPYEANEFGHEELRLIKQNEIDHMINTSEIQDACTLIAYYRYKQTLTQKGK
jgi:ADP-ribose pyrophosphatase